MFSSNPFVLVVGVLLTSSTLPSLTSGFAFSPKLTTTAVTNKQPKLPINVINLEQDTGRWHALVQDQTSKGVNPQDIHRIPAVHGKKLSDEELEKNTSLRGRLFCTKGMIGCYMSHVKFWRKVASSQAPYQLLLEDDAVVCNDFHNQAQNMVNEVEQATQGDWDVLMLGAFSCIHPEKQYGHNIYQSWLLGDGREQEFISPNIQVPHRPLGAHAYILSKRGARKLLQQASLATWHVDCVMWGMSDLNLYLCDPLLAHQDYQSPSTLGAVTQGMESLIPKLELDTYTRVSLEWWLNEPFFKVPFRDTVISIGRYVGTLAAGIVACLALHPLPAWVLPLHVSLFVAFATAFTRIMKRPVAAPVRQSAASVVETRPLFGTGRNNTRAAAVAEF